MQLKGLQLIQPKVFRDNRGFFIETFRQEQFDTPFVQDNHSFSAKGTIRGMHFQSSPGQAKLVRCAVGKIYDVAVDIRPDSPTFGQWEGVVLDSEHHNQLFIPVGFAHGFCVLSEQAHVLYKVSTNYNSATEVGFRFDDPDIAIQWPLDEIVLSERDKKAPFFKEIFA